MPSFSRDPLADPEPLIRRVYAYVAYRLGDGPEAEDVTSDVFERAVRYRSSYIRSKGSPEAWLVGIARRTLDGRTPVPEPVADLPEAPDPVLLEEIAPRRLDLQAALATLEPRDRDLLALRYGADLTARQIAELLELRPNAVEVALHRALARLRARLGGTDGQRRANASAMPSSPRAS